MKKPLISASEIGVIVKEFLGKNFETQDTIEQVITRKFFLSSEEREVYDNAKNLTRGLIFNRGKDFEAQTVNLLIEDFKSKYKDVEIIDFNNFYTEPEDGKKYKLLVCENLSICCVPDILVITDKKEYNIIEIKSSDYNTEMIEAYKYQIAMQGLLLAREYNLEPKDFTYRLILQETKDKNIDGEIVTETEAKTLKIASGSKIWGSFEDVESYQKDIILAINRLWEAFEKGSLGKYRLSFDEMMKPFVEAEDKKAKKGVIEIEDKELIELANDYLEEKEREKSSKHISDTIKQKLNAITQNSATINAKAEDGSVFKISYSISAPIYWTEEMKDEAIAKARAIEIGSLKTKAVERLSIKI